MRDVVKDDINLTRIVDLPPSASPIPNIFGNPPFPRLWARKLPPQPPRRTPSARLEAHHAPPAAGGNPPPSAQRSGSRPRLRRAARGDPARQYNSVQKAKKKNGCAPPALPFFFSPSAAKERSDVAAAFVVFCAYSAKNNKALTGILGNNPAPVGRGLLPSAAASGGGRVVALLQPSPPPSAAALSRFPTPPVLSAATAADKTERKAARRSRGRLPLRCADGGGFPPAAGGAWWASNRAEGVLRGGCGGSFRAQRRGNGGFPKMFGIGEAEGGRSTIRVRLMSSLTTSRMLISENLCGWGPQSRAGRGFARSSLRFNSHRSTSPAVVRAGCGECALTRAGAAVGCADNVGALIWAAGMIPRPNAYASGVRWWRQRGQVWRRVWRRGGGSRERSDDGCAVIREASVARRRRQQQRGRRRGVWRQRRGEWQSGKGRAGLRPENPHSNPAAVPDTTAAAHRVSRQPTNLSLSRSVAVGFSSSA